MSNDGLTVSRIALPVAYAAAMTGGQALFKAAAPRCLPDRPIGARALSLIANTYFLGATALGRRPSRNLL